MNAFNGFALRWTLDKEPSSTSATPGTKPLSSNDGERPSTSSSSSIFIHQRKPAHGSGDSAQPNPIPTLRDDSDTTKRVQGRISDPKDAQRLIIELLGILQTTTVKEGSGENSSDLPSSSSKGVQGLGELLGHIQTSLPSLKVQVLQFKIIFIFYLVILNLILAIIFQDQIDSEITECLQKYFDIRKQLEVGISF